jgi:pantoate--beta-alanine ligase
MHICKTRNELNKFISDIRKSGKSIGFVPTMGALHNGHLSLIEASRKENDCTIVSIFVNPLQFNNVLDFNKYPVETESDLNMLGSAGVSAVFLPENDELYEGYSIKKYDLGHLDSIMEGAHRPGHFNGVANVVSLMFSLIVPDRSYFGEKDYQQIAVIRKMAQIDGHRTEIIPCPTIRNKDGLALSSRNRRLTSDQIVGAASVSAFILGIPKREAGTEASVLRHEFENHLTSLPGFRPEYLEIADSESFEILNRIEKYKASRVLIAYYAGDVRLIDNCALREVE